MIIDSHTHIARLNSDPKEKTFQEILQNLLEEMKSAKIDRAFILPTYENKSPLNCPTLNEALELTSKFKNLNVITEISLINPIKSHITSRERTFLL